MGTSPETSHDRQILGSEFAQSVAGNNAVPTGTDGILMSQFSGAVRATEFMLTLALTGGGASIFEVWGRKATGSVWGSLGRLEGGATIATAKTYSYILRNIGLFDYVYVQSVSGAATWTATISEIFESEV